MQKSIPVLFSSSVAFRFTRPITGYLPKPQNLPTTSKRSRAGSSSVLTMIRKLGRKADSIANGVLEHVKLAPNITETVKGKLRLGARIVQVGGSEKIFQQLFNIRGEKLLNSSHCYLSTSAGPIAGLLFISTDTVAFCSDRPISISSPHGEVGRLNYKVLIPLRMMKRVNQRENAKNPSKKYIQVVTVDDFDFWFMGFLNYEKAFKFLQKGISEDYQ